MLTMPSIDNIPSCVTFSVVPVRQAGGLPVVSLLPHPASFRFHLAADTLALGWILPTAGRIRVSRPLETRAAGHTQKSRAPKRPAGIGSVQRMKRT